MNLKLMETAVTKIVTVLVLHNPIALNFTKMTKIVLSGPLRFRRVRLRDDCYRLGINGWAVQQCKRVFWTIGLSTPFRISLSMN